MHGGVEVNATATVWYTPVPDDNPILPPGFPVTTLPGHEALSTRAVSYIMNPDSNFFNDRSCLIMTARLTMYDTEMTDAFTDALDGCGFRRTTSMDQVSVNSPDTYTVSGTDVYISWKTIDSGYRTR